VDAALDPADLDVPLSPAGQGMVDPDESLELTATLGSARASRADEVRVSITTAPLSAGSLTAWLAPDDASAPALRTILTLPGGVGAAPFGGFTARLTVTAEDLGLPLETTGAVYGIEASWVDDGQRIAHGRTVIVWNPKPVKDKSAVTT